VSSRLAYPWHWPNDPARPGRVTHSYPVPPMPELVQISVGDHHQEHGQPPYYRVSFTFTRAFPSYRFEWASKLVSDASGKAVPLAGTDVLKIVFDHARAHTADGKRSTIVSQPGRPIGYQAMTDYAQAGDYEGVLTYGIGTTRAVRLSNPQTYVRAYEVETVTATGQHRYVVAIDIQPALLPRRLRRAPRPPPGDRGGPDPDPERAVRAGHPRAQAKAAQALDLGLLVDGAGAAVDQDAPSGPGALVIGVRLERHHVLALGGGQLRAAGRPEDRIVTVHDMVHRQDHDLAIGTEADPAHRDRAEQPQALVVRQDLESCVVGRVS
jgi:hypothetical protein